MPGAGPDATPQLLAVREHDQCGQRRVLLLLDLPCHLHGGGVASPLGHSREQVEVRLLRVLVGEYEYLTSCSSIASINTIAMPQNFIESSLEHGVLLPRDVRDWLPADHLAWL